VISNECVSIHAFYFQVEEFGEQYQRLAWGPLLDSMQADADETARGQRSDAAAKVR